MSIGNYRIGTLNLEVDLFLTEVLGVKAARVQVHEASVY